MNTMQYTYTKEQLELLSECIRLNIDLHSSLFVFFDTAKLKPTLPETLNWLRHAECIRANPDYIQECMARAAYHVRIEHVKKDRLSFLARAKRLFWSALENA